MYISRDYSTRRTEDHYVHRKLKVPFQVTNQGYESNRLDYK